MTLPDSLEQLLNDKRFKIAAGVCGAVILLVSMVLLGLSSGPMHKASTRVVAVLPEVPYNIPILRSLPEPQPMVQKAGRTVAHTTRSLQTRASPWLAQRR